MDEQQQRSAVVAEGYTWQGTRYHHHARIKGVGVDCANLLVGVYHAVNLVGAVDLGNYAREWHQHHDEELFLGWLEKLGLHRVQTPGQGDIAVYKFGRCFSHGAIVMDDPDMRLHSHIRGQRGVMLSRETEEPLRDRPVQYWSIWA
jgi:cell wall-associated NlpC family hydrolase